MGIIEILSTASGHDKVTLNENPLEAKNQIDDFLRRRYALFVRIGDEDCKVQGFDVKTNEVLALSEKRILATSAKLTAVAPQSGG